MRKKKSMVINTHYRDKYGREICVGDRLGAWISSDWDENVPRFETAITEYYGGHYRAQSENTGDQWCLDELKWEILTLPSPKGRGFSGLVQGNI